jgi:hypothetical protein
MRYALFFVLATVLSACGGTSVSPHPDAGADAGAMSCAVGDVCAEVVGCPCTIIDECGCEPTDPQCQFYTCLSDTDGSQCLVGHECAAGHCAVLPQPAGKACAGGACDASGACVAADGGST